MSNSGEQEFNELLAKFGDQAPTLRRLLEGIGNPLQAKINATEARLKVAEEEMEQLKAEPCTGNSSTHRPWHSLRGHPWDLPTCAGCQN